MDSKSDILRKKVLCYLQSIENQKCTLDTLHYELNEPKKELRKIIKKLLADEKLLTIPIKRHGRWYWNYYIKPIGKGPINQRLEEIFEELAIPPFIDIMINRGFKVIFIGKYGSRPGFAIIDYNNDPPLIFKDKMYGGKSEEIIFYKKRSRYRCIKDEIEIWYNLHGRKMKEK